MSRLLIRRLLGLSSLVIALSACSTPSIGSEPRQAVEVPVQLSTTPVPATATWTTMPVTNTPTDVPATHTPTSAPTDTPAPPTDTPAPPTDTPVPPTDTPAPPTMTTAPAVPTATLVASGGSVNPAPARAVRGAALPRGGIARRPWMVMIDNHPDAYPQSGIDKAAVVFEGLAEYGITRFIATFADGLTSDAAEIGPVRSTRVYFAQLAMGFHPIYVYAGGSPDGLQLVRTTDQLVNFDADRLTAYSYRDKRRRAPQNLYVTSASLRKWAQANGVSAFGDASVGYLYAEPAPLAQPQVTSINYYFQDRGSAAGFVYNANQNVYFRTMRGRAHVDRITGAQLWTNNVVVMQVSGSKRAGDDKARIDQNVIGSGAARVFKNGGVMNATWVKNSAAGPLRFYDAAGNEIVFSNGSLWIAAIPSLDRLAVK